MNTHNDITTPSASASSAGERSAADLAQQGDDAIAAGQRVTQGAADSIQDGLESLRDDLPALVASLQRQTETYMREQPVKAVLLAAAAGAVVAMLLSRNDRAR